MAEPANEWEAAYQRNVTQVMGSLSALIDLEFGERCDTFSAECPTCKLWKLHDEIHAIIK